MQTIDKPYWPAAASPERNHTVPAAWRNLLLATYFLKNVNQVDAQKNGSDTSSAWYLPEESSWATIVANPTRNTVLLACMAFEEHSANMAFRKPFEILGLYEDNLDDDSYATIVDAVDNSSQPEKFMRFIGNTKGPDTTPPELTELAVRLLDPEPGCTIYDPACGEADLLIAAYQCVMSKGAKPDSVEIHGQDVRGEYVAIARLCIGLCRLSPESIAVRNSLERDECIGQASDGRYTHALSHLPTGPWVSAYNPDDEDSWLSWSSGSGAPFQFVEHITERLDHAGRAVVIADADFLYDGGDARNTRKMLIKSDLVESVISLPSGLSYDKDDSWAIIVLNKKKPHVLKRKVQFVYADEGYYMDEDDRIVSKDAIHKIFLAVEQRTEVAQFAKIATTAEIAQDDYLLTPAVYLDFGDIQSFLGGSYEWCVLSDLADITEGVELFEYQNWEVEHEYDDEEKPNLPNSRAGDVLVFDDNGEWKAQLVTDHSKGTVIRDNQYIVRLRPKYVSVGPFLTEFINSARGKAHLASRLRGQELNLFVLRALRIPLPEPEVLKIVEDLHQAELRVTERVSRSRSLLQQLFGLTTGEEGAQALQSLRLNAKLLGESIAQTDDFNFRVRNFYPYPVAYAYRLLDAIGDPGKLYHAQIAAAENLLAFIAIIGLALLSHQDGFKTGSNDDDIEGLLREYWHRGMSHGNWRSVASVCAVKLSSGNPSPIAQSYVKLWYTGTSEKRPTFAINVDKMVKFRNHFHHSGGVIADEEYVKVSQEMDTLLKRCLSKLDFLIHHPVRCVDDVNKDWRTGMYTINTHVYAGDHPGMRKETLSYPNPLIKPHLYAQVIDGEWASLHPLISVQYCPECKTAETYFVDYYSGPRQRVKLKSFERGHIHENDDIAHKVGADLDHWLANTVRHVPS